MEANKPVSWPTLVPVPDSLLMSWGLNSLINPVSSPDRRTRGDEAVFAQAVASHHFCFFPPPSPELCSVSNTCLTILASYNTR